MVEEGAGGEQGGEHAGGTHCRRRKDGKGSREKKRKGIGRAHV